MRPSRGRPGPSITWFKVSSTRFRVRGWQKSAASQWVGPVVDTREVSDRDVGIALGGRQAAMPQELLDGSQIRASLEHVRRTRVAQQVWMDVMATERLHAVLLDDVLDLATPEPSSALR